MRSPLFTFLPPACLELRRGVFGNTIAAFAAILCLLCPAQLKADETYGDFYFTVTDSQATIAGYTGSDAEVTIPDTINGYPVISIGAGAFNWCTSLTSITIPDSVTSIGANAFSGCTSLTEIIVDSGNANYASQNGALYNKELTILITVPEGMTSITIPDSVTSIVDDAFSGCSSLTSITLGDGVTSIGDNAFYDCTDLTEIIVNSENASYTSQNGALYNNGLTTLIVVPRDLTSFTIPGSVTSIGNYAFYCCRGLTSVTLGDGVISIGEGAFSDCYSLTSITIPDGVTSIGNYAFYCCDGLTSVTLGYGVISIGNHAFDFCSNITSITLGDGVTSIGNYAFSSCSGLTSITIPDSVTSIGDYTFYCCRGLTSVTLGDGVATIGNYAFASCDSLTSITIPDSVTSIGNYAFGYCPSLTRATFCGDAPTMGSSVFGSAASGFCIYYPADATGYTGSPWSDYTLYTYTLTDGPTWSDSTESVTSPGWYDSSWYGWFYAEDSWGGDIYSVTNGWQYVYDFGGDDGIAAYDYASACWWFTAGGYYPYIYNYTTGSWQFYVSGTAPTRSFYDYNSDATVIR